MGTLNPLLPMVPRDSCRHRCLLAQQSKAIAHLQSWVRRGGSLGPVLFALNLQRLLEETSAMNMAQP
jgi:hypothetical protein